MLTLCWSLSAAIYGFMQRYMPTNRVIAWLRTSRGFKWTIPVALITTPAYLFAMSLCLAIIETGGPGWLHLLFLWAFWNSAKFACMAILAPFLMAKIAAVRVRERRVVQPVCSVISDSSHIHETDSADILWTS